MARVRLFDAGRRHTHTAQAELDLEGTFDRIAVLHNDEINDRIGRRRRWPAAYAKAARAILAAFGLTLATRNQNSERYGGKA